MNYLTPGSLRLPDNSFLLTQHLFRNTGRIRLRDWEVEVQHACHASFLGSDGSILKEREPHAHERILEFHLILVGKGSVWMEANGWRDLRPGDLYWALPGERHQNRLLSRRKGYEMLHYSVLPYRDGDLLDVPSFCRRNGLTGERIVKGCHDLLDVLQRLEATLKSPLPFSRELSKHYMKEFLYLSFQKMAKAEPVENPAPSEYALISRMHALVAPDLQRVWTLESLADLAGYSPRHLSRIWRSVTRFPPMEFVIRMRLEHSRKLLIRTDLTLEQIGADSGFSSTAYFCRTFKRVTGVTPNHYRRHFGELSSNLCWR